MQNVDKWLPSKYKILNGNLLPSDSVSVGSLTNVRLIAESYQRNVLRYIIGKTLDLGCGNVPLYEFYKDKVTELTCIDWNESCHDSSALHLDIIHDINKRLPFEDQTYDTVILSDVLEHVQEPIMLMSEIKRILRKGGCLILNTPFMYGIHEAPYDYHRFTKFALRQYCETLGMKIHVLDEIGGVIDVACDIFSKVFSKLPIIGSCFATLCNWLSRKVIKLQIVNKFNKTSSTKFTLGYFLVCQSID